MAQAIFDTLAYSETLQEYGIPAAQANAFARAQQNALEQIIEVKELATKRDLKELELRLEKRLADQELRLTKSIEKIQKDSLKLLSALIAQTTITLTGMGVCVALLVWLFPR